MPHVSRYQLGKEVEEELLEIFLDVLVAINDREFARNVIRDLFTPTERIMIGKRLLVAVLLLDGYDYKEIANALKVTPTTVNSVKVTLAKSGEGLKAVYHFLREGRVARSAKREREEKRKEFYRKLDHLLDMLQLPVKGSRSDMRRWKRAMGQ